MINWFKNLKIFRKIFYSFCILLVLSITIGIVSLLSLQKSNNINKEMYEKEFIAVKHIEKTINTLNHIEQTLKDKILSSNASDKKIYNDRIDKLRVDLLVELKKGTDLLHTQKNKDLSAKFNSSWVIFQNYFTTANNLLDSNNQEDINKANEIIKNYLDPKFNELESILEALEESKFKVTGDFYNKSQDVFNSSRNELTILIVLITIAALFISYYVSKAITNPIFTIKQSLKQVTEGNLDNHITAPYNDETGEVIKDFNIMISSLKESKTFTENQNWLKDGLNKLSTNLSGDNNLQETAQKSISFIASYLSAGSGVIYNFDSKSNLLNLISSYAFTERSNVSNKYQLGEGIIGQVAIEKQPILLKNIKRDQQTIVSGLVEEPPLNIYAFPLLYENKLYGVVELSSFELFDSLKQDFLLEATKIISTYFYSTIQSDKVKDLLVLAEQSQKEAMQKSFELQKMNAELEEQQQQLQQQTEEMQRTNAQLEEHQQQLQQQTEELKQSNAQLEEQKQQVQQQEEETRQMNGQLIKAQKELDERANQLELSNKYKAEFLANMSHELRTPLNSIILLSQILSRNKKASLADEDIEKVKVINNAGNELLRLINDILDLSKIESGKATVELREFYLKEVINEQLQYFESLAGEKGLDFKVQNKLGNDNIKIESDSQKISQILRNFLSNAFKFTKEGSIYIVIDHSGNKERPLKISVKDSGLGVPKDKQELIFQAFRQVDGSTSRVYGGTGLGLSIALELAKLLKGEIMLESEDNHGSSFSLLIPYSISDDSQINQDQAKNISLEDKASKNFNTESVKKPVTKKENPELKIVDDRNNILSTDKVILIIEDDYDFANSVRYVNQDLNLKSIIAYNGKQGLEFAFKYKPAGIILDMGLPDIDGMQVLHELKTTRELKHIPVHIISGNDKENFELKKQGAMGFKQKPVSEDDLNSILSNLINFSEKKEKKVLVVEDNDVQLSAITELIEENGIKATGVSTEENALIEIDKNIYDLIIVDLSLREGSGYQICNYIRQKQLNIPIIIYTGKVLSHEEEDKLKKISDTIVIKTVHSGERLLDEISMFLHVVNQDDNSNYISKINNIKNDIEIEDKKILIVDDDIKNIFVLTAALEQSKAEIYTAKNGKEALDELKENPDIDLILMDIMMPVMNGYEAIEAIRADAKIKHIPIIAATAKALKDDKIKCFEAGANDYITKPIDFDVLVNIVEKWIDKRV